MIFKRTAKKWIEFTVRLIIVDNVICIHKQFRAQSGKGKMDLCGDDDFTELAKKKFYD